MGTLSIWIFFIGAFIACRAMSFAAIQWEMFSIRKSMCIERIVNEQRACDFLVAIYHTLVTLFGFWLMLFGGWEIFRETIPPLELSIAVPVILIILFGTYQTLRLYLDSGYDLTGFYEDMVAYRKKQEVVTDDNDNEVSFLRTYRRIKKHKWYALAWMIILIAIVIYNKVYLMA